MACRDSGWRWSRSSRGRRAPCTWRGSVTSSRLPSGYCDAETGARGAICAERQGRFAEFTFRMFSEQDSIGKKAWTSFAVSAGTPDTPRFSECLQSDSTTTRVSNDQALLDGCR